MPRKFDLVEVPELVIVLGPDDEGTFPVSADCGDAHWDRERKRIVEERAATYDAESLARELIAAPRRRETSDKKRDHSALLCKNLIIPATKRLKEP